MKLPSVCKLEYFKNLHLVMFSSYLLPLPPAKKGIQNLDFSVDHDLGLLI